MRENNVGTITGISVWVYFPYHISVQIIGFRLFDILFELICPEKKTTKRKSVERFNK